MGFLDTIEADGDGLIIPIPSEERSFPSIAPQSLESLHKSSLSLPHTSIGWVFYAFWGYGTHHATSYRLYHLYISSYSMHERRD
jgi:hypothetical protein